jgi:hypothetical protein
MPEMQPIKQMTQGERPVAPMVFRKWGGCYTRSSRTSMPKDRWYHLENLQPIGDANMHTVNNISASIHDFAGDTIYWAQYANISSLGDLIFSFATNGKVFQTIIATGVTTQISAALSGAGSKLDQWKNLIVLFIDANGLYSWDGTTFTHITVAGAPSAGQAIAVYQGRVWVANGRLISYSVPADTNGVNTGYGNNANDWATASGAGTVILTDPQLRSGVQQMVAANGYLYWIGRTSINVIADVYVPVPAPTPPTPQFTNLNIQAIIGTDQPAAVFPFGRQLIIGNRFGAYALSGTTAQKISDDIDGTWQYITLAQPLSGGQVVINNILTAAILLNQTIDPEIGQNTVIAMWCDGKWWFANFGNLTFVFSAYAQNNPALFGFLGNKLYQLFQDSTTSPNAEFIGPLWDMDDPVRTKEVLKAGMETLLLGAYGSITLSVDGTNSTTPLPLLQSIGSVIFLNNLGQQVTFFNNLSLLVNFLVPGYALFWSSTPGTFGKYVGLRGSSIATQFQLSGLMLDYEMGARWSP